MPPPPSSRRRRSPSKSVYVRAKAYRCETDPARNPKRWTAKELRKIGNTHIRGSPLFYEHEYNKKCRLGEIVEWFIDDEGWLNVGALISPDNEFKQQVLDDIDNGNIDAFSIGYLATPSTNGETCAKQWMEASVTGDPDVEGAGGHATIMVCHSNEKRVLVRLSRNGTIGRGTSSKAKSKRRDAPHNKSSDYGSSLIGILRQAGDNNRQRSISSKKKKATTKKMAGGKKKTNNKKTDTRRMEVSDDSDSEPSEDENDFMLSSDEEDEEETAPKKTQKKKTPAHKRRANSKTASDSEESSDEEESDDDDDADMSSSKKKESLQPKKGEKASVYQRRIRELAKGGDPRAIKLQEALADDLIDPLEDKAARMDPKVQARKMAAMAMQLESTSREYKKTKKQQQEQAAELERYRKQEARQKKRYAKKRDQVYQERLNQLKDNGIEPDDLTAGQLQALYTSKEGEQVTSILDGLCSVAARKDKDIAKLRRKYDRLSKEHAQLAANSEGFEPIEDSPLAPEAQRRLVMQHSRAKSRARASRIIDMAGLSDDDSSDEEEEEMARAPAVGTRRGRSSSGRGGVPDAKRRRTAESDDEEDDEDDTGKRGSRRGDRRRAFLRPKEIPGLKKRMGNKRNSYGRNAMDDGLFRTLVAGSTAVTGQGGIPDETLVRKYAADGDHEVAGQSGWALE